MNRSEAHKLFEDTNFALNQKGIPLSSSSEDEGGDKPKKDHRVSFNIGAFNDGLRTSFCKVYIGVANEV